VTSLSDRLGVDFALIHREKFHKDQSCETDDRKETRLTLVGDVKGKICFLMVNPTYLIPRTI
jgi:ribose-phosphate pyrophosphokinase